MGIGLMSLAEWKFISNPAMETVFINGPNDVGKRPGIPLSILEHLAGLRRSVQLQFVM
jgi:hypothetical protein